MNKLNNFDLAALIDNDTTILTPNRRLAATLHKRYQQQQQLIKQAWLTPTILPLLSFLQLLWTRLIQKEMTLFPLLLSTVQEDFLWEHVIKNAHESGQLLRVSETAQLAKTAWGLLKTWRLTTDHPTFISDAHLAFKNWACSFAEVCKTKNVLDNAELINFLVPFISHCKISLPKRIILLGFTEISPQLQHFFSICGKKGCKVEQPKLSFHYGQFQQLKCATHEDELYQAARFAKSIHLRSPEATIGCVVPNLERHRDHVLQLFSEVFNDDTHYGLIIDSPIFNISAGKSLIQYPIIQTALQLLNLNKRYLSLNDFSQILSSPFIGEAESERFKRARYEAYLRTKNINRLTIEALLDIHQLNLSHWCPALAKRLHMIATLALSKDTQHTFDTWSTTINQFLTTLGWPGERSLESHEYQTVENWLNLLTEFTSLDAISARVNWQQAYQALYKITAARAFQPKTPEAPIQVLGTLEAAGIPFDYLWICNMDDQTWPGQPKPNPFIPKNLQREQNMPHATAQRELAYCQSLLTQFRENAAYGILSVAEKNEEIEIQPSPMLKEFPTITIGDLNLAPFLPCAVQIFEQRNIEIIIDDKGPEICNTSPIRGGVSVLKHQAMCPFRSFAQWRLSAQELECPQPGLRSKDRGTLLHKSFELLWRKIKDHATLENTSEQTVKQWIKESVAQATVELLKNYREQKYYLQLEQQRLQALIWDWLQEEKVREPFKVLFNEYKTVMTLNRLSLTIRIDRIDELKNGERMVIDYKTGKQLTLSDLFSSRPEEPQLPLYALHDPDKTTAIAFAQLLPGASSFKGISRDEINIKGIKTVAEMSKASATSWQEQLNEWHETLHALSDEFILGVAKVQPKNDQACTWCALKPLCRIEEEIV